MLIFIFWLSLWLTLALKTWQNGQLVSASTVRKSTFGNWNYFICWTRYNCYGSNVWNRYVCKMSKIHLFTWDQHYQTDLFKSTLMYCHEHCLRQTWRRLWVKPVKIHTFLASVFFMSSQQGAHYRMWPFFLMNQEFQTFITFFIFILVSDGCYRWKSC